jgi:hypothetical protein
MIKLKRAELIDMATAYIVANTARSLYDSLLADCAAVSVMRHEAKLDELLSYYDQITARPRSGISVGLAYGVLVAILLHKDNFGAQTAPDTSRLQWGEHIHEIAKSANSASSVLEVIAGKPKSQADSSSHAGSTLWVPKR